MRKRRHYIKQDSSWIWMVGLLAVFFISLIVCYSKACLKINGTASTAESAPQEIELTPYNPPTLKSLIVHPESTDNYFDFILDTSDEEVEDEEALEPLAKELIDYFFLGITLPSDDLWVNLNSVQESQVTSPRLALTDIGKVLLEADLTLKRDCSRFTDPRTKTGKEYWDNLQKRLNQEGLNTTRLPIGNRFWIIPLEASVEEDHDNHTVTIVKSKLKVCLEQEYLKLTPNNRVIASNNPLPPQELLTQQICDFTMKETILPHIQERVNKAEEYAKLRQVYNSLILAEYYKQTYHSGEGLYPQLINRAHLQGLESTQPWNTQDFYDAYVKSAQEGEYRFSQQEYDPFLASMVQKYYFYGGVFWEELRFILDIITLGYDQATLKRFQLAGVSDSNLLVQVLRNPDGAPWKNKYFHAFSEEGDESHDGLQDDRPAQRDEAPKTMEELFAKIDKDIAETEISSMVYVPVAPGADLDLRADQIELVVRSGKPLEFGSGLLYHGRDGLDQAIINGEILGPIRLTREPHKWAVGKFNPNSHSPAIFVISTAVFNRIVDQGKAGSLGLEDVTIRREFGVTHPYPSIQTTLSLNNVEEIWIDMETYERYKKIIQNPITESDNVLKSKTENLFRSGKLKVIPYLVHSSTIPDRRFELVGKYMAKRNLFEQVPPFKEKRSGLSDEVIHGQAELAGRTLPQTSESEPTSQRDFQKLLRRKTNGTSVRLSTQSTLETCFGIPKYTLAGKDVVLLGCGAGSHCFAAVLKGANRAVGVDIDENSIAVANILAPYIYDPLLKDGLMQPQPRITRDNACSLVESLSKGPDSAKQLTRVEPENLDFIAGDATNLSSLQTDSFHAAALSSLLIVDDGIQDEEGMRNALKESMRVVKAGGTIFVAPYLTAEEWGDGAIRHVYATAFDVSNRELHATGALVNIIESCKEQGFAGKRLVEVEGYKGLFLVERLFSDDASPKVDEADSSSQRPEESIPSTLDEIKSGPAGVDFRKIIPELK